MREGEILRINTHVQCMYCHLCSSTPQKYQICEKYIAIFLLKKSLIQNKISAKLYFYIFSKQVVADIFTKIKSIIMVPLLKELLISFNKTFNKKFNNTLRNREKHETLSIGFHRKHRLHNARNAQ